MANQDNQFGAWLSILNHHGKPNTTIAKKTTADRAKIKARRKQKSHR